MSEKDKGNFIAILDAIQAIETFIKGIGTPEEYFENRLVFDATLMNFVLIGEMVERLSDSCKSAHPEVGWKDIKDFRNLVAHDYLGIDAEEVWQIIHTHIPLLKKQVIKILADYPI